MSLAETLATAVASGMNQVGQIRILHDLDGHRFSLCHRDDAGTPGGLEVYSGPQSARDLSTWAEDGHYRFTKGELSLRRGWLMHLESAADLLAALDGFYPAAVGLWVAETEGRLKIQHLRDKLNRQTGMYRFAREISDAGAQQLVKDVCGPENCCAKKILWSLDAATLLEASTASDYDGLAGGESGSTLPLLCREACNHFVAEARRVSKEEKEAARG